MRICQSLQIFPAVSQTKPIVCSPAVLAVYECHEWRCPNAAFHLAPHLAPRSALARNIYLTSHVENRTYIHTRHTARLRRNHHIHTAGIARWVPVPSRDRWSVHRFRQTPTVSREYSGALLALSGRPDRMKPYSRLHGDNFTKDLRIYGPLRTSLKYPFFPSANPSIFVPNHGKSHDEPPITLMD